MAASDPSNPHPVRLLVGGRSVEPVPGGFAYNAFDALTTSIESRRLLSHQPGRRHAITTLVMVEAVGQGLATALLERLIAQVIPILLAQGDSSASAAKSALRSVLADAASGDGDIHVSVATIDWPRLRVLYAGGNRHVLVHGKGQSTVVLTPRASDDPGMMTSLLVPGDWLVVLAHASSDVIPLARTGLAVRDGSSPQAVCTRLVRDAAGQEPFAHHAAVALAVEGLA
jgi:hypothetical protein